MGLRLINSGRVAKFISAARSPVRERTSSCPANWRAGSPKTKAFLLREEPGRSTSSRNWSVARVISVLTLRQYENALSQINKGIGVSVGSYFFASRAAISARIQEIRRMGLEPSSGRRCFGSSPSAQPCAPGATSTGPLVDDR